MERDNCQQSEEIPDLQNYFEINRLVRLEEHNDLQEAYNGQEGHGYRRYCQLCNSFHYNDSSKMVETSLAESVFLADPWFSFPDARTRRSCDVNVCDDDSSNEYTDMWDERSRFHNSGLQLVNRVPRTVEKHLEKSKQNFDRESSSSDSYRLYANLDLKVRNSEAQGIRSRITAVFDKHHVRHNCCLLSNLIVSIQFEHLTPYTLQSLINWLKVTICDEININDYRLILGIFSAEATKLIKEVSKSDRIREHLMNFRKEINKRKRQVRKVGRTGFFKEFVKLNEQLNYFVCDV